jgi:hypothetical protein
MGLYIGITEIAAAGKRARGFGEQRGVIGLALLVGEKAVQ